MEEMNYLQVPDEAADWGASKVMLVRKESIHFKQILTEIFVHKSVNIEPILNILKWDLGDYMEYMTNRLRHIYKFPRTYDVPPREIIEADPTQFFPYMNAYRGLNNILALDFDGVVTDKQFNLTGTRHPNLYDLCLERANTVIVTANPNPNIKNLPHEVFACKGKVAKIKRLLQLNMLYDNVFYVDNEKEYLEIAWIFGIKTYLWNRKITYFTRK